MSDFELLQEILEQSLERNGDIPLTLNHLKNIIKMLNRHNRSQKTETELCPTSWDFGDFYKD